MNTLISDEQLRSGFFAGSLLAAVWAVAAVAQPTSTYHLAPILIAGIVPILARSSSRSMPRLIASAAAGGAVALVASVALVTFDLLRGPTLLPYGGAFAEAITFTAIGAVAGLLVGWLIPGKDAASH